MEIHVVLYLFLRKRLTVLVCTVLLKLAVCLFVNICLWPFCALVSSHSKKMPIRWHTRLTGVSKLTVVVKVLGYLSLLAL